MQEQQSPVEAALAELNANLAVARTQSEDHVAVSYTHLTLPTKA